MPKNPRKFKMVKSALKPQPKPSKKIPEWIKPSEAELNIGLAKLKWKKGADQSQ